MARIQLFESDVATNPRIELFYDDSQPAGETGFELDIISAADSVVETINLTASQIQVIRATWENSFNKTICLTGGTGSGVDTHYMAITRDNTMVVNVLDGATPEYANLTTFQATAICAWLICGHEDAAA